MLARQKQSRGARLFCDILNPDRTPYPGDARWALKRVLQRAKKLGFTFYIGPELEYFYFKNDHSTEVLDEGTYFELIPNDIADVMRNKTVDILEHMGIPMETGHHEVAPSQHEIDLKYDEALIAADNIITAKYCIKEVARSHGAYATFMPKPIFGVAGSGMHIHQSLFKAEKNAFFDKNDKNHLSIVAKQFIAGQLKHAREICALTAQWVNSYKRLVAGYEAPVYVSWAHKNRTAMIGTNTYAVLPAGIAMLSSIRYNIMTQRKKFNIHINMPAHSRGDITPFETKSTILLKATEVMPV